MTVSIRFLGIAAFEIITAQGKRARGAAHGVPEYRMGEMDAREASLACGWLRLRYAITCHHDDISLPEIVQFADLLNQARRADPRRARARPAGAGRHFQAVVAPGAATRGVKGTALRGPRAHRDPEREAIANGIPVPASHHRHRPAPGPLRPDRSRRSGQ